MLFKRMKYFSIIGLFGSKDINVPINESVKILIGENGLGKTQFLNIFYYTLTRNFQKLTEFPFTEVKFKLGRKVYSFTKKELNECFNLRKFSRSLVKDIYNILGEKHFDLLSAEIRHSGPNRSRKLINEHSMFRPIRNIAPAEIIVDYMQEEMHGRSLFRKKSKGELNENVSNCSNAIKDSLSGSTIMYFPTFRRVEEDLHNLGYSEEEFTLGKEDSRLIHFGMHDVQRRFNLIEKKIDFLLKEGFTKISSEILSQLIKGFGNTDKEILDKITKNDIDIILARVGNQISEKEKTRIRNIVEKREISETDNSLIYFLQILIDIYEKQKEFDESINRFRDICNKYLIGKQVSYDESNIKIFIKSDDNKKPIDLSRLSSGEKQIISFFSKIYLSEVEKRFIILFDEPELSLSMTWQKQLLPDILKSNKCDFLLAVTHSPFIFDNELDEFALGLNEYVTQTKK